MKSIVIPKVVGVSPLIHVWQVSIRKLNTVFPVSLVAYLKVALRAKQNAVAEKIRTVVALWLPVMWLPATEFALESVGATDTLATGSTQSSLTFPSLLYSVGRKGHSRTSRIEAANPRVKNGWIRNEDMWVLIRDGISYNIAVMYVPPWMAGGRGGYAVFKGHRTLKGLSRTLVTAKRRAEKIKTPRQPYK